MQATDQLNGNPLKGIISTDQYEVLAQQNLLNEKGVRDYRIRRVFRSMRRDNVSAYDAIEHLREEYPYLQFDTIRKIVYRMGGSQAEKAE
jgi:hypothetical protein